MTSLSRAPASRSAQGWVAYRTGRRPGRDGVVLVVCLRRIGTASTRDPLVGLRCIGSGRERPDMSRPYGGVTVAPIGRTLCVWATTTPAEPRTRPSLATAGAACLGGVCGAVVTEVSRVATAEECRVIATIITKIGPPTGS